MGLFRWCYGIIRCLEAQEEFNMFPYTALPSLESGTNEVTLGLNLIKKLSTDACQGPSPASVDKTCLGQR